MSTQRGRKTFDKVRLFGSILLALSVTAFGLFIWTVVTGVCSNWQGVLSTAMMLSSVALVGYSRVMQRHLENLNKGLEDLAKGNYLNTEDQKETTPHFEVLKSKLQAVTHFAEKIASGDFDATLTSSGKDDTLTSVLVGMSNKLQEVAAEDQKRNWTREGLTLFAGVIRKNFNQLSDLGDQLIRDLVKYTQSNQGSLFIVKENQNGDEELEMLSCYAWERKKHLTRTIALGEGIIGQAWIEKSQAYFTDIPKDYIKITSGLGDASPRSLLVTPLAIDGHIWGVLELASFHKYEVHERDLVSKVGEIIASAIKARVEKDRMKTLLESTQEMAEELRTKEEELKQNIEELSATQEAMERKNLEVETLLIKANRANEEMSELNAAMRQKEVDLKYSEQNLKSIIDNLPYALIKTNHLFAIESINPATEKIFSFTNEGLTGQSITSVLINFNSMRMREGSRKREKALTGQGTHTMTEVIVTRISNSGETGFMFLLDDISEKLRKEQEMNVALENLEQSKEELVRNASHNRKLIETIPGSLIRANASGAILHMNKACTELLGWAESDLIGQPISMIFPGIDDKLKNHSSFRADAMNSKGTRLTCEVTCRQLDGGEVLCWARDVREDLRREQELLSVMEELALFRQSFGNRTITI